MEGILFRADKNTRSGGGGGQTMRERVVNKIVLMSLCKPEDEQNFLLAVCTPLISRTAPSCLGFHPRTSPDICFRVQPRYSVNDRTSLTFAKPFLAQVWGSSFSAKHTGRTRPWVCVNSFDRSAHTFRVKGS